MSFTTEVILTCLLTPALTAGMFAWIAGVIERRREGADEASSFLSGRGGTVAAIGWCVAMATTLGMRHWRGRSQPWSTTLIGAEAWQQVLWPMVVFAVVLAINGATGRRQQSGRVVLAALAATLVAFTVLPTGDGWVDLYPLHRPWFGLVVGSCLVNVYALERLVRTGAASWCLLVLLAALAVPAVLNALNYAAPAEWSFAAIAATVASLCVLWWFGWRGTTTTAIWTVLYPGCVMIASMTATARFYTYEDYPAWVYATSLFLPVVVLVADLPFRARTWKWRVPVAGLLSVVLIAACIWRLVLSEPADNG